MQAGEKRSFYSTMQGQDANGVLLREYTAKEVTLVSPVPVDEEVEPMWRVRAKDGTEFDAYEGELNGHYKDTQQFYGPWV